MLQNMLLSCALTSRSNRGREDLTDALAESLVLFTEARYDDSAGGRRDPRMRDRRTSRDICSKGAFALTMPVVGRWAFTFVTRPA